MYHVTIFGLELTLDPVAFTLPIGDGWPIYWYGIIIALGFLLAIIYGMKNAERLGVNTDKMLDVVIVTTPVAIICARLYYILFDPNRGDESVSFFGADGLSGIGIYGAVIGAFACGAIMCKIKKINVFNMFDLAAIAFLIGQGIGRWGNFMNQEAFGSPTGSSWFGMTSENVMRDFAQNGYATNALAHPCFLYESIWCILGFFILHKLSKKRHFSGEITLFYCVWYGFERAIIENFRTDSLILWGSVRVSVVVSIVICIGALITLFVIYKKRKAVVAADGYTAMFDNGSDNDIYTGEAEAVEETEQPNE